MTAYILRRLLLIVPTLVAIMVINFVIVQAAPGGPIDQVIAQIRGQGDVTSRLTGGGADTAERSSGPGQSRGTRGLDPEFVKQLEKQFGFDKPLPERFVSMMASYVMFDFGDSFFKARRVTDLVLEKMPVSISLGLWTTLLVYLISIPLGIRKAVRDGSRFDIWTSGIIIVGNAIPSFLFAVLLVVLFAGGSYLQIFPLRGLVSSNWAELGVVDKVLDYLWHMVLPITAMVIGGFASLTMLTKNSFLDEINKQYVVTAKAKGLTERGVLYGHVFRNAMLLVIAGFPSAFVSVLFAGSLFIEIIFSIDGLGLLGYEAALQRDYPVMFGTLFFFTLLGLLLNLIGDLMYVAVDPRIDFETRES
ncbi:MAG: microcin C ABC transporter permease YejB [Thalassobaculum sp.]|uniref:microcin C ABC transporter permease YejB n=1 Tax=Thalassobaculum sp. TaxID=2022740 RepID=UPI0032F05D08